MDDRVGVRKTMRACCIINMGVGLLCTMVGAILPAMMTEYGLSYGFAGSLSSVSMFFAILALVTDCFLPARIGEKRTVVRMTLLMVVGPLLLIVSGNPVILIIAAALIGLGRSGVSIINNIVARCSDNVSGKMNVLHALGAVGTASAPLLVLLFGLGHWRIPVLIIASWSLFAALAFSNAPIGNEGREKCRHDPPELPKDPDYWITVLMMFIYSAGENTTMTFLVVYMLEKGTVGGSMPLFMQSLLWMAIIIGRFSCAWLSRKMKKSDLLILLSSIIAVSVFVLLETSSAAVTTVSLFILGLGMSGFFPTGISSVQRKYAESEFSGSLILITATFGGLVLPLAAGHIADGACGMVGAFGILIPASVLLILITVIKKCHLLRTGRKAD